MKGRFTYCKMSTGIRQSFPCVFNVTCIYSLCYSSYMV